LSVALPQPSFELTGEVYACCLYASARPRAALLSTTILLEIKVANVHEARSATAEEHGQRRFRKIVHRRPNHEALQVVASRTRHRLVGALEA
jgi:hypothetical protein